MSLLAREAQRGRIQLIMKLIDTQVRPEIQRNIAETIAGSVSASRSVPNSLGQTMPAVGAKEEAQPGVSRIINDRCASSPGPGPTAKDTATTTQRTISDDRDFVPKLCAPPGTINNSLSFSSNKSPSRSSVEGLSGKPGKGNTSDSSRAVVVHGSRVYTTFDIDSTKSECRTARLLSIDQSHSFSSAISLRHVRSDYTLPLGVFQGATPDDLLKLDELYETLGWIVQSIDMRVAALVKTASERFDRHIISTGASCTSTRRPRQFKDQEEWQTGGGYKTQWNPDADWGSEMAWSEVKVKQAKPGKKGTSSKLRHQYLPCDWSLPAPGSPFWEADDPSIW
ncbi:hypothetical protein BR93DRAFT_936759 [Coniochaeta sp. PMI_546]|nr:hypothetical protein BR93DRAFT_936759 [Coniochaeta sp. PMI_546]